MYDAGTGKASFLSNHKELIYLDQEKIQVGQYNLKYFE